MGLTAREKLALHAIEARLARSDLGLAPRLAIFTRLASGEEMPARERIERGWRRVRHRPRPYRDGVFQQVGRLGWRRGALMLCVAVAVIEGLAVVLALGLNGPKARQVRFSTPRSCSSVVLERLSGCRLAWAV